jgi:hypothetical protein
MTSLLAVSGRVYFPPCSPTTLLVTADTFYAHPFIVPPGARGFDQIGLRVTTAGEGAGADVRLAIYKDANGSPGRRLNGFDPVTGLVETGAAFSTMTPPLGLMAGRLLWLACVFDSAEVTMPTVAAHGTSRRSASGFGSASFSELPTSDEYVPSGVSAAMAYGAFPEFAPEATPVVGAAVPLMGLRAA